MLFQNLVRVDFEGDELAKIWPSINCQSLVSAEYARGQLAVCQNLVNLVRVEFRWEELAKTVPSLQKKTFTCRQNFLSKVN